MALLTNARTTFSAIGIREDLSNIIYNISPMDTPFLSSCGRDTCDNTLFEWQTDSLAAAAANQQLEGDVPDALAVTETKTWSGSAPLGLSIEERLIFMALAQTSQNLGGLMSLIPVTISILRCRTT